MFTILDAHVHYWPAGPQFDPAEVERYRMLSRAAGVGRSILLGSVGAYGAYPTPENLRDCNDQTMALVQAYPDLFAGLVYVNPSHPQNAIDEINRCVRDGNLIGIKLWVSNRASDPRVFPVAERALALDIGILQHTWNKTVGQGADESTTLDVAELARRFPKLRIQVAHLTGINFWGVLDLAPFPNVTVDTSGGQPQSGLVEYALRHLGPDRVVYGSDWPVRDQHCQVAKITGVALEPAIHQQILSGNACRFWKLPPPAVVPTAETGSGPVLVDATAWVGPYPSNRHFPTAVPALRAQLAAAGISAAHVAPTGAIFGHEPADDCLRLADEIQAVSGAGPTLTPALCLRANQPADIRRLPELARATTAKLLHLLPAYHGYAADAPCAQEMIRVAAEHKLVTVVHVRLEDRRCTDPRLLTDDVPVAAAIALARAVASVPVVFAGAFLGEAREILAAAPNAHCSLALVENGDPMADLCQTQPAEAVYPRLLFASHAPFLYPAAVVAKLNSPRLNAAQRVAIASGNLAQLLVGGR